MAIRHLIILAMLAGFVPAVMPALSVTAEATHLKKQKKKTVQAKKTQARVKTNFRAPLPGEPNAGWSDDCMRYYELHGGLPFYCNKYGRSSMLRDSF